MTTGHTSSPWLPDVPFDSSFGTPYDNLVPNPGFEIAGAGDPDFFESWVENIGDGSITDETIITHSGSHALKITRGAVGSTSIYNVITVEPEKVYCLLYWTRGDGANCIRHRVYDQTGAAEIVPWASSSVIETTYTKVEFTFTTPAGCTAARVYFQSAGASLDVPSYVDDVSVYFPGTSWQTHGAVAIQFDDHFSSVYDIVFPLMEARGLVGTIYVNNSTIGWVGHMTEAQLIEMNDAGWDIANHTVDHADLRTLSVSEQYDEFVNCKIALDALGMTRASMHVAYPSGWYNADTLTAMADANMLTGRLSNTGWTHIDPPPVTNLFEIISPNPDTLASGIRGVDAAEITGGVYVYHQHDIGSEYFAGGDLSAEDFAAWLDYIVSRNIPCITISQLYARL